MVRTQAMCPTKFAAELDQERESPQRQISARNLNFSPVTIIL